ncbi:hypothetical protein KQH90_02740 [Anaerosalibacter bizertensis]|uniref:hypothetical protein n=1 Tax=Anaerosalibacter bizertensis TaxID=932217 RepID=UPI001C0EAB69|nr:hypothetical protein [Anaerosalibacter bizertensis]MBU5292951.1 hypothetical protein [Anaerosalibacter bizertensis]
MILIEINIINFKEVFRKKYGYYNNLDMNVLKEYKDNILFYERKMNNSIKLYKFNKKDYNIKLLGDIIINEKWEEPEGQYKDYTITRDRFIRNRFILKILKIIEGIGLLLDYRNTLLIY